MVFLSKATSLEVRNQSSPDLAPVSLTTRVKMLSFVGRAAMRPQCLFLEEHRKLANSFVSWRIEAQSLILAIVHVTVHD